MTISYNNSNAVDNIKIVEDFFPSDLLEKLMDYVYLPSTRWDFNRVTTNTPEEAKPLINGVDINDTGQYVSVLLLNGRTNPEKHPFLVKEIQVFLENYFSQGVELLRIKLNRQQPGVNVNETQVNEPHWDHTCVKCMSIVVYLTDAEGDTVIYDCTHEQLFNNHPLQEYKRIIPRINRAVILPSFLMHASSPARGLEERIVINIIFRFSDLKERLAVI